MSKNQEGLQRHNVLANSQEMFGDYSPTVVQSKAPIAKTMHERKSFKEAGELYQRALEA